MADIAATTNSSEETSRGAVSGLHWSERAFIAIFLSVAVVSLVGITLVELHVFSRLGLGAGVIAIGALVLVFTRKAVRNWPANANVTWLEGAAVAGILTFGALVYFRPGQFVFAGSDGSIYLALATVIERTGGVTYTDPLLDSIPEPQRSGLFAREPWWPIRHNRFSGGIQIAPGESQIVPNFLHLTPTWIAALRVTLGPNAGYYVNSLFAVLNLMALWLLGRRLTTRWAAVMAPALLAVNFLQIWFARFPISEVMTSFFWLSGMYFVTLLVEGPALAGLLTGTAFGLAAFVRVEALFGVAPVVLLFLLSPAARRAFDPRARRLAIISLAVLWVHALLYAFVITTPYALRIVNLFSPMGRAFSRQRATMAVLGGVIVLAAILAWLFRRWIRQHAHVPVLGALAIIAVLLSTGYARFPLTPLGLLAAFAGVALIVHRGIDTRTFLPVSLFLVSSLIFAGLTQRGYNPWTLRRYIPATMPLGLLFASYFVFSIRASRSRLRDPILFVPAALGVFFVYQSWPIIRTPVMQGAEHEVNEVVERLPPRAIAFFDTTVPSQFAVAAQFFGGRDSIGLYALSETKKALGPFLDTMARQGRPVFLITSGERSVFPRFPWENELPNYPIEGFGMVDVDYVGLREQRAQFPTIPEPVRHRFYIYRVGRKTEGVARTPLPLKIDIGEFDVPYAIKGFYEPELMQSVTARWTWAVAEVRLPALAVPANYSPTLAVRFAMYRPAGVALPPVDVELNGKRVGRIEKVQPDFGEYRFQIAPADLPPMSASTLAFRTTTFVPKAAGGSDVRQLGIAVDWIEMR